MNGEVTGAVMRSGIGDIFAGSFGKFKNYLRNTFSGLNEYDAEDIVQQTALSMLGREGEEESIEYVSSYIYAALRNGARNYFRKHGREVLRDEDIESGEEESAEDAIIDMELNESLMEALSMLDEKSRYVLEKTEFEGKSYKELSQETGEPIGTLLSRKNRAIKKLIVLLSDYEDR